MAVQRLKTSIGAVAGLLTIAAVISACSGSSSAGGGGYNYPTQGVASATHSPSEVVWFSTSQARNSAESSNRTIGLSGVPTSRMTPMVARLPPRAKQDVVVS